MSEQNSDASGNSVVLIVDDEPGLLQLFAGLMARLPCSVLTAESGEDAIAILNDTTPDLLILDLAMPGISGYDVLQHVRGINRLDSMTVMILTARPHLVPEVEALGIDYWVSKPILPRDFLEIVRDVLESE
ncbi:MAG: response regulator [Chloroflexi bacterium]|jgi:DNA-binding response OmpR family regulator|nr:response regulator [Chloroflexota bacterium]